VILRRVKTAVYRGASAERLLISAPSLGVYYFLLLTLVCLCVCPSVCLSVTNIASFLFLDGIEPFLGHQFSITKTTKHCSSIFDLGPLTPIIYYPKFSYGACVMTARAICAHKDMHVGTTLVAMAMTFGLGAEIKSPTGLTSVGLCPVKTKNVTPTVTYIQL